MKENGEGIGNERGREEKEGKERKN